ncbi:MAG: hypothetical protein U9N04_01465 [Patescibacteria group bacterium]|nr:hypothetical protein [Patescibacteria group bacterium]
MKNKTKKEVFWTLVQITLAIMIICIGMIGLVLLFPIALIEHYCIPSFDENTIEEWKRS